MSGIKNKIKAKRRASRDNAEDSALVFLEKKLAEMQLKMPRRPTDKNGDPLEARLPRDLTLLTDAQLGRRYTDFCRLAQYTQLHLAYLGVEKAIAKQKDKYIRAESRLLQTGPSVDKVAKVEIDPEVRARTIDLLSKEGIEKLTNAMLESYIIGKEACSRELTRRQSLGDGGGDLVR